MKSRKTYGIFKGIGEKTEKLLEKVGITTVGDFLGYYPRDYDEYKEPVTVREVKVEKRRTISIRETWTAKHREKVCCYCKYPGRKSSAAAYLV